MWEGMGGTCLWIWPWGRVGWAVGCSHTAVPRCIVLVPGSGGSGSAASEAMQGGHSPPNPHSWHRSCSPKHMMGQAWWEQPSASFPPPPRP